MQDVEEVFNSRKDFILNDNEIVIKKVNWEDKPTNLNNIAKELNIGIESLVFIDDSKFEINFVNELIPEITTYLVPERHYEYPTLINNTTNLFFNLNSTLERMESSFPLIFKFPFPSVSTLFFLLIFS